MPDYEHIRKEVPQASWFRVGGHMVRVVENTIGGHIVEIRRAPSRSRRRDESRRIDTSEPPIVE